MSEPYDSPKVCEVCGSKQFYHYQDGNYDYCVECNASYDEDGNLMPEGPLPKFPLVIEDGQNMMSYLLGGIRCL